MGKKIYVFFICVFIVPPAGENLDPKMPTVVTLSTVPPDIFSVCFLADGGVILSGLFVVEWGHVTSSTQGA